MVFFAFLGLLNALDMFYSESIIRFLPNGIKKNVAGNRDVNAVLSIKAHERAPVRAKGAPKKSPGFFFSLDRPPGPGHDRGP